MTDDPLAHFQALSPEEQRRLLAQLLPAASSTGIDLRGAQMGAVTTGDVASRDLTKGQTEVSGTLKGLAAGVISQSTIQIFFGGKPGEDGAKLLAAYLTSILDDCQRLRLNRLTGTRQSGKEQPTQADSSLRLQDVFTSLTTDGPPHVRCTVQARAERVRRFLKRLDDAERSAAYVPPERVIAVALTGGVAATERKGTALHRVAFAPLPQRGRGDGGEGHPSHPNDVSAVADAQVRATLEQLDDDHVLTLALTRPELVLEAIFTHRRLVLLGEPGAGKSTALRYLALLLAQRLAGAALRIPGWPDDAAPIPVVVPLGQVAAALRAGAADAYSALLQVIGDLLEAGVREGLRAHLTTALRNGGLLLLCDGLDELPATTETGRAPRVLVAAALRRLAAETQARMVVTSRVLPYRAAGDWKLLPEDGWTLRTVQPLALGQTRAFVRGWYAALGQHDPDLAGGRAAPRATALIEEIEEVARLHPLVESPLLLTMLAILHYNTNTVPRDRAKLYEECVLLLFDRWEPERQPGMPRERLIERLGLPTLDPLRQVIHELAYQAHLQPPGDDGRGMIGMEALEQRMFKFFQRLGSLAEAEVRTQRFLAILADEDSGLLQRRGDEGYALPHLTFQEYLAACHLADHPKMLETAYQRWIGTDRERWREALLLLMGRLHQQGKADKEGLPWLKLLTGAKCGREAKAATQRHWDAVLAARSYRELHERGAFAGSMLDIEAEIEAPLLQATTALLHEPDAAITTADRIVAAQVLGTIGDPRFPVTREQWHAELERRNEEFGHPAGYWCYVREGSYRIGGWKTNEPVADIVLPAFWLARYPITVAQYAPFVEVGYGPDAERWWTPQGWQWKQRRERSQPWKWDNTTYNGPNQPVIGVTWYEATAYCAWLSAQLQPTGYLVRLPTEAEWEAAAAYDVEGQRQTYPWGEAEPTPELAIYDASKLGRPVPVGCCPSGAAPCGALDLAGNVWEWTCSHLENYPARSGVISDDFVQSKDFSIEEMVVPLRGGGWGNDSSSVRCGARDRYRPGNFLNFGWGFRVILAPRSHIDSDF